MKLVSAAMGVVLLLGTAACSSHNQEKAKEEIREDAHKTADEAKKAGHEIKEDAKEVSQRVDAVVKPDSETASDKLSNGSAQVKDAAAKAGVHLDHAALLAQVKSKLITQAGLSTLTNIDVTADGSVVTLAGTVSTEDQKKAAEEAASQVNGVSRVHNNLVVQP